tara:strand:+ start:484 stop:684 length:201 start_codon:yes stop_codon:yes gene_type:complete
MIRKVVRGQSSDTYFSSLLVVYSLARAFSISPMEVYAMPSDLVLSMLQIHGEVELYKAEEMKKGMK